MGHSWGTTTKVSKRQPTRRVCIMGISSLQNERFARDFPKTSHSSLQKERRLHPKVSQSLQNEHFVGDFLPQSSGKPHQSTHQAALPSSVAIPAPPNNTRSHANPNVTATFAFDIARNLTFPARHEICTSTSNTHKVLRLPRHATSATPRNLTIPCACHETCTSTPQILHKALRLRLPQKVTISCLRSFSKMCTTPHASTRSDLTKRCTCEVTLHTSSSHVSTRFLAIYFNLFHTNLTRRPM